MSLGRSPLAMPVGIGLAMSPQLLNSSEPELLADEDVYEEDQFQSKHDSPLVEHLRNKKQQSQRRQTMVMQQNHHMAMLVEAKANVGKPMGTLAIHLKEVACHNINPEMVFANPVLNLYLKLSVGDQAKCTCMYENVTAPTNIIFDDMKHFSLELSPEINNPCNFLRIEVIVCDPLEQDGNRHMVLSRKNIHLFEIVKKLYCVEVFDMTRKADLICKVDTEICFAWGAFGYGYSNQLENRKTPRRDQVAHSMFYRDHPPPERMDLKTGVMTPILIGHPMFINFTQKVNIGHTHNEFANDVDYHNSLTSEEPLLLISRMRKRMYKLQRKFSLLETRKERLNFLYKVVYHNIQPTDNTVEVITQPKSFRLRRRVHSVRASPASEDEDEDDDETEEVSDIKDAAVVLKAAPVAPVVQQDQSNQEVPEKVVSEEKVKSKPGLQALAEDEEEEDQFDEEELEVVVERPNMSRVSAVSSLPGKFKSDFSTHSSKTSTKVKPRMRRQSTWSAMGLGNDSRRMSQADYSSFQEKTNMGMLRSRRLSILENVSAKLMGAFGTIEEPSIPHIVVSPASAEPSDSSEEDARYDFLDD